MNSQFPRFLCVVLLALTTTSAQAAQDVFTGTEVDGVRAFLRTNFSDLNRGMVIGLLDRNGSRVFSAGKLDNGTDAELDGDTVFGIGSVTKVFTALLALDMERRGEWKLDDPVAKHLPEGVRVPAFEGRTITLRNLARQDSGLPWHPDSLEKALQQEPREKALQALKKAADAFTAEDLHQFLPTHRLTNAPGARFRYSNVGMALLGHAAERRAGESFESLVVQRICGPLGMNSTRIKLPPPLQPRLARAHWADGERAGNLDFQVLAPAGALLSSVNDLLKFVAASLGFTKSELSPLLEEMQVMQHSGDPRFGSTATPWVNDGVYQPPRSVLLGHGGGGFGYLAFIGFDKGRGRGVVVLSNQVEWGTSGVGWTILQGLPLTRDHVMSLVREIVGLGIALDTHKASGLPVITRVFPGSSAGQAGVKPGQLIRTINGVAVAGKTLNECLALMGGEPGAKVTLELSSADRKETSTVELTRQKFITTTEG